jgi:hypothetical protein
MVTGAVLMDDSNASADTTDIEKTYRTLTVSRRKLPDRL